MELEHEGPPDDADEETKKHWAHMMSRSELEKEKKRANWTPARHLSAMIAESHRFELSMAFLIAVNFVLMVLETDQNASCASKAAHEECSAHIWLLIANNLLLACYTAEASVKLFAFRRDFFKVRWNNIDFAIVFMGLFDLSVTLIADSLLPNMNFLRMFRIARLVRAVRVLTAFRELYLMVNGFLSAMMSLLWGFLLMCIMCTVWSILAVELIHPVNLKVEHLDVYCDDVFSSVYSANLMFFQTVVAGDSWGLCAIPIIRYAPWTFPVFAGVLFTVQIGLTNLILAVIVEQAAQAREADQMQNLKEQKKAEESSRIMLLKLCKDIDTNDNGELTKQELEEGFEMDPKFAMHLQLLGIERDMIGEIFEIMDRDHSGAVDYEEFIDTIHKSRTQDMRMLLTMVKFELFLELTKMKEELGLLLKSGLGQAVDLQQPVQEVLPEYLKENYGRNESLQLPSNAPVGPAQQPCPSQAIQSPNASRLPLPQEGASQPTDSRTPDDLKLFLETLRVQMSHMLDSVTSKVREQTIGEEKAKLDLSNFGGSKASFLPPTFTPDGQWQLCLKSEWQPMGPPAQRIVVGGPETKDGFAGFRPAQPGDMQDSTQTWSLQPVQRSLVALPGGGPAPPKAPPPRTTPLSTPQNSAYTCEPLICSRGMEVIHISRPGLPPRSGPVAGVMHE